MTNRTCIETIRGSTIPVALFLLVTNVEASSANVDTAKTQIFQESSAHIEIHRTRPASESSVFSEKTRNVAGYAVGSNNKRGTNGEITTTISVKSPTGDMTEIVTTSQRSTIYSIRNGKILHRLESPDIRWNDHDDFVSTTSESHLPSNIDTADGGDRNIDFLFAYSTYALAGMRVDPVAYALAQLETAQTGLRNAQVAGINLRLAGVAIFDTGWDNEYGTSSAGLSNWQTLLAPYRAMYGADMNSAYTRVGPNGGIAYKPGYTSVNLWYGPTAFRHELGHNVGGSHCNTGGANDYRFGYDNGKSKTFLCGNTAPYYSNPAVTDSYGLPLGDAKTANMARLWREQADRMVNYTPALPGERFFFVTTNQWKSDTFEIHGAKSSRRAGIVATAQDIGPTRLAPLEDSGYSVLNVALTNSRDNKQYTVKFRAQRQIGNCPAGPMNSNVECPSEGLLKLILTYHPVDNKSLPLGTYNGLLTLAANDEDSTNSAPIQTVISLARTAIAEAGWDFAVSSKPSSTGYPMNGSNSQGVASARWTIVDDPDHKFWLQEAQGAPWIRQFDGLDVRALVPPNTTGSVTYRLTVTDKYGLTSSTDIKLTVK